MRLVCVHRAGVLGRPREAGVTGRDEHVRGTSVAVELEAAVDRADAIDAARTEAPVPAAPLAHPLGVLQTNSSTRGW